MTPTHCPVPHRFDGERGSATAELVLLTPLIVGLLLLIVAFGRFAQARSEVDEAARDAARAASIARNETSARTAAEQAAAATLQAGGVSCRTMTVDLDLADFRPGGNVAAHIACVTDLADVSLLRLPGSKTFAATSVSVIDTYRATTS
jgi:Flp pilus assembly protein TadG